MKSIPRVVIAGLGGDSGKTFVSCGVLRHLKNTGYSPAAFKKGPDYIDPAWLTAAGGVAARNLDTYLFGRKKTYEIFCRYAENAEIAVIEGNRGIYDGFDEKGSHSTAEMAKLLKAPVIVSLTVKKVTRTAAAFILGLKKMDPGVNIAGVIINQTAGKRHQNIVSRAIEEETGVPVIGAIPKLKNSGILPSRHLGLVTPAEHFSAERAVEEAAKAVSENVDFARLLRTAQDAPLLEFDIMQKRAGSKKICRIGVFKDRAFSFYYPENLEALEDGGAELVYISSIDDERLPRCDAVYIGGGFPETNILEISANKKLMSSLKAMCEKGMPVYAECGGLIYLCRNIDLEGKTYPLAGIFPAAIKMNKKPAGHGYAEAHVIKSNPFYPKGLELLGHEFHYTNIESASGDLEVCLETTRGAGAVRKMAGDDYRNFDGLVYKNVFASYMHIHSEGLPQWSEGLINRALDFKNNIISGG